MTERTLSVADAALRERVTELSVHIPCGGLRGPLQRKSRYYPELPVKWQSCSDEDSPEKWAGEDLFQLHDLCIICFRATAGRNVALVLARLQTMPEVNDAIASPQFGLRSFALGRRSLMNGIGIRGGTPPDVQKLQHARLVEFLRGDNTLREWRKTEHARLASRFDPGADIALRIGGWG
jgi:hypothetical protein